MTTSEHTATRRCRRCNLHLHEEAYSPSQWKHKWSPRCKECCTAYHQDRRARQHTVTEDLEWKRCRGCGEVKLRDAWVSTNFPELSSRCRNCQAKYKQDCLGPRRQWRDEYKSTRGCIDCGYNDNPALLDFDHLDDSDSAGKFQGYKAFTAAMQASKETWERLKLEVQTECVVRCKPCHSMKTAAVKVARSKAAVNGRRRHAVPDVTEPVDVPTHLAWDQLDLFEDPTPKEATR